MATSSHVIAERAAHAGFRTASWRRERRFFGGMAIALALTVFAGFAPTYYLSSFTGAAGRLTPMLHWHGAAFTAWMLFLMTQTSLISASRAHLHSRLGFVGIALAALITVLGALVAITRVQDGLVELAGGTPPLVLLAIPLATIVVFPAQIGAAYYFRTRSDFHKRLMLIATLELVTAAVGRFPALSSAEPIALFGLTDLFLIAIVIYDLVTLRRVHPATVWGGLFLIASQPLRLMIAATPAWQTFATWLTS